MTAWVVLVEWLVGRDEEEHDKGAHGDDKGGGPLGLRDGWEGGEVEGLGSVEVHGEDMINEFVDFNGIEDAEVLIFLSSDELLAEGGDEGEAVATKFQVLGDDSEGKGSRGEEGEEDRAKGRETSDKEENAEEASGDNGWQQAT